MKFSVGLSLLLLFLLITGCADDESPDVLPEKEVPVYFSLSSDSYWTYVNSGTFGESYDSLYVSGTETVDDQMYTDLDAEGPVGSFMTGLFAHSKTRVTDTQLLINGQFEITPIEGFSSIIIPSVDFILYDIEAPSEGELSTTEDEITQNFMDVPLTVDYQIKSIQGDVLDNFPVGDHTFEKVITSKIIVNLSVTSEIDFGGFAFSVPVLKPQDVFIVTNYYAQDLGLVFSEVLEKYELEDLSSLGVDPTFPTEASVTTTQSIDNFFIAD